MATSSDIKCKIADERRKRADEMTEIADERREIADEMREIDDKRREIAVEMREIADKRRKIDDKAREITDERREKADDRREIDEMREIRNKKLVEELRILYGLVNPYILNSLLDKIEPILKKYGITSPSAMDVGIVQLLDEFKNVLVSSNSEPSLEILKPTLKKLLTKRRINEAQMKDLLKRLEEMRGNQSEVEGGDIVDLIQILKDELKPVCVSEDWITRFKEVLRTRTEVKYPVEEGKKLLLNPENYQALEDEQKMIRGKENASYLVELAELYYKRYNETEEVTDQLMDSVKSLMKRESISPGTDVLNPIDLSHTLNLYAILYQRWTHLLKSHGLYVAASIEDRELKDEYIRKSIDIHKQTVKNVNEQTLRDNINGNINKLKTLREHHKSIVAELDILSAQVNVKNVNTDPEFLSSLEKFTDRGEFLLCQVSDDTKDFLSTIMSQSVEFFSVEFPLCVFAIGSLARGEASSFSDIEFGFLIEDSVDIDGPMSLCLDMFYRLNYLEESNLKTFDIAELKLCNFYDFGPKGIRIDGISSKAGNMPTGNGSAPDSELCFNLESFLDKLRSAIINPHQVDSKNTTSDFADMVTHTCRVWSNKEGADLYCKLKVGVT